MIDRDQVLHVAKLARLRLTDEEVERMAGELSNILEHVEKIDELTDLGLDDCGGRRASGFCHLPCTRPSVIRRLRPRSKFGS